MQLRGPGKIQRAAIQAVASLELNPSAGNVVLQCGQIQLAVVQVEVALHMRNRHRQIGRVGRISQAALAQFLDAGLNLGIGEKHLIELKGAIQLQPLVYRHRAGRNVQCALERDGPSQHRRGRVAGEQQEVFDARLVHYYRQGDVVAQAAPGAVGRWNPQDVPLGGEMRVAQSRIY